MGNSLILDFKLYSGSCTPCLGEHHVLVLGQKAWRVGQIRFIVLTTNLWLQRLLTGDGSNLTLQVNL